MPVLVGHLMLDPTGRLFIGCGIKNISYLSAMGAELNAEFTIGGRLARPRFMVAHGQGFQRLGSPALRGTASCLYGCF